MKIDPAWSRFRDVPDNPLLEPPPGTWLLGDPTVLAPDATPDGRWHLFANTITSIHHWVSNDGWEWEKRGGGLFRGIRACLRSDGERFWLFYESFAGLRRRVIAARYSRDLCEWSEAQIVLEPELSWEGRIMPVVGNPCVLFGAFGARLYYSASSVVLWDTWVTEPRHIGLAEAETIAGPWRRRARPMFSPSPEDRFRNLGAGAIKVYAEGEGFVGLNNGIYRDDRGRSRSAILLLQSADGYAWEPVQDEPILAPEPGGWKAALVYQLDVVRYQDELRLYYNARDGWRRGRERIGAAVSSAQTSSSESTPRDS